MNQVAVIGLGRFGMSLAKSLTENRCQVLAIDSDMDKVKKAQHFVTHSVQLNATDEEALKAVGINEMDAVVVAIGSDTEASMLTTMTLKDMGVGKVIVKAVSELHGRFLEKIGADQIVYPEIDTGRRLGRLLAKPAIIEQIEFGEEYGVYEIQVPESWVGKTIGEVEVRAKYGVSILAIRGRTSDEGDEKKEKMLVIPVASSEFQPEDIILVLGHVDKVKKLITKK
jgi:trk system potassium uptake protein TrkA